MTAIEQSQSSRAGGSSKENLANTTILIDALIRQRSRDLSLLANLFYLGISQTGIRMTVCIGQCVECVNGMDRRNGTGVSIVDTRVDVQCDALGVCQIG